MLQNMGHIKERYIFDNLDDNYAHRLYGYIKSTVIEEKLVDSVFQKTFVQIWNLIDKIDLNAEILLVWMLKIANQTIRACMQNAGEINFTWRRPHLKPTIDN